MKIDLSRLGNGIHLVCPVESNGLTLATFKSFAGLSLCLDKGDPIDMENTLSIFPIIMTTLIAYVKKMRAAVLH